MKRMVLFTIFGFLLSSPLFFTPAISNAQQEDILGVEIIGQSTDLGRRDIGETIGSIINILLGLLGAISLAVIIYAGFMWMTAGGSEERVGKAKKTLWAAVVGLIIILSSYAFSQFVLSRLFQATTGFYR